MRKSTLIATCLLNSSMASDLATAAHQVQQIFAACYPSDSFAAWNTDIPDETAQRMIASVGRAQRINVEKAIADLWQ